MNTIVTLCSALLSGILATVVTLVVTNQQQKKNNKREYKMQIFRDLIAFRTDITGDRLPTGYFQRAINQVFIAYNDSPEVITAFEDFRKTTFKPVKTESENDAIVDKLIRLLKAMANDLSIDYSFSNDDLFTRPILIGKSIQFQAK